ncbi:hypothetical protein P1P75_10515 [Streptomyces sp. ID05-39B]|uniref:hypothetical protein n=1 Tax=Streptomyces sp. ID05-39B TaxID=3028664 RepID=UPI0029B44CB4|nr:hypothetical protein [Streptomyces sp. ID05-39B]MDX3526862.1 hypothetical protein [Streptomyces sp. ID05-39B]
MKTKRLVIAGVVAMALAGGAGTALAVDGSTPQAKTDAKDTGNRREAVAGERAGKKAAGVRRPGRVAAAAPGPRVVRPYAPVDIGQGAKMGLLPEGRQNYVVAWDDYEEAVEQAKSLAGDSIRPNSISGGMGVDGDDVLFTGAFRTDTVPARITLRIGAGSEVEAGMLRLPGTPGWGTYFYDAAGAGRPQETVQVTAYDADGSVLADLAYEPSPASR